MDYPSDLRWPARTLPARRLQGCLRGSVGLGFWGPYSPKPSTAVQALKSGSVGRVESRLSSSEAELLESIVLDSKFILYI